MTDEQILNNRRAWQIMSTQYDGIEKWQRMEVYGQAVAVGTVHEDALRSAHEYAVDDLPEIVFEADTIEMVGDLTIESGTFDPPLKTWDTRSFGYQERTE